MYTQDDLIDCILEILAPLEARLRALQGGGSRPSGPSPGRWEEPLPRGRPFLTEREIKKALTPGAEHLTIAKDAIVSPLAMEWLELRGIRIVREG